MTVSDMIKCVSLSNQSKTFIQNSNIDLLYCVMKFSLQQLTVEVNLYHVPEQNLAYIMYNATH